MAAAAAPEVEDKREEANADDWHVLAACVRGFHATLALVWAKKAAVTASVVQLVEQDAPVRQSTGFLLLQGDSDWVLSMHNRPPGAASAEEDEKNQQANGQEAVMSGETTVTIHEAEPQEGECRQFQMDMRGRIRRCLTVETLTRYAQRIVSGVSGTDEAVRLKLRAHMPHTVKVVTLLLGDLQHTRFLDANNDKRKIDFQATVDFASLHVHYPQAAEMMSRLAEASVSILDATGQKRLCEMSYTNQTNKIRIQMARCGGSVLWTDLSGEPLPAEQRVEEQNRGDHDEWERFEWGKTPELCVVLNVKMQLMGFHVQIPRCRFVVRQSGENRLEAKIAELEPTWATHVALWLLRMHSVFDLIRHSFVAFVELSPNNSSECDDDDQRPDEKSPTTSQLCAGISVRMPTSNLGRAVVIRRVKEQKWAGVVQMFRDVLEALERDVMQAM